MPHQEYFSATGRTEIDPPAYLFPIQGFAMARNVTAREAGAGVRNANQTREVVCMGECTQLLILECYDTFEHGLRDAVTTGWLRSCSRIVMK